MDDLNNNNNNELHNIITEEDKQLYEKDLNDRYSYCEEQKQEHIEINTLNSNDTIERVKAVNNDDDDEYEEQIDNNNNNII